MLCLAISFLEVLVVNRSTNLDTTSQKSGLKIIFQAKCFFYSELLCERQVIIGIFSVKCYQNISIFLQNAMIYLGGEFILADPYLKWS